MNICDSKEVPYINTYLNDDATSKSVALNMYPNLDSLTQLVLDYVNASEWKAVIILYESPLWLRRIANILELNKQLKNRINIRNLDYTKNNEFRPTLQEIRDSDHTNIVLECSFESLPIILRQAMQVGLMTKHHKWIITNLDAHSINLEPYQYSGANITTFRILDTKHPVFDLYGKSNDPVDPNDLFNVDPESRANTASSKTKHCNIDFNGDIRIPVYPAKFSSRFISYI